MTNINNKNRTRKLGALFCLFAATLFTCEKVPDFCGRGLDKNSWLKEGQFCFGDAAYNLCTGKEYNPLIEGCDQNTDIGTRCQDGSAVPKGTPCGGYTLTTAVTPARGGSITRTPSETVKTNFAAGERVVLIAIPEDDYTFLGWAGEVTSTNKETAEIKMSGGSVNKPVVAMFKLKDAPNTNKYTLTATAFPEYGGDIAHSPNAATYNYGESVTVTATASPGYTFDGWSGDVKSTNAAVSVSMTESRTLVAMFTPTIYKIRANANPEDGGAVFVNGTALAENTSRDVGTEVVVWARPADGYSFTGWSGAAATAGASNPATINVTTGGATITANFKKGGGEGPTPTPQITYTMTTGVSPPNGGGVSLSPDATAYGVGTPVTATATPAVGYKFTGWSGASKSANTSVTIVMDNNKTLIAEFQPNVVMPPDTAKKTYTVTVSSAGTGASGGGNYTAGATVSISSGTAPAGMMFKNWTTASAGVTLANANNAATTFTMPANAATVTANFEAIPTTVTTYTLTTSASPSNGGSVTRTPNQTTYESNASVAVTAVAASGYRFTGWSGASTSVSQNITIVMNSNKTLTAGFEAVKYTVTVSNGALSSGSSSGSYTAGETVSITAGTAPSGQQFKNWTTTSSGVTFTNASHSTTTFTMPANAATVTAVFEPIKYAVTISSAGTGATGNGSYAAGTTVSISAGTAPTGQRFKNWTTASNGVTFANANNSATTFTMPANAATVTAVFEATTVTPTTYAVTISSAGTGATGSGSYAAGATVSISAGTAPAGQRFKYWTSISTGVMFNDSNSATTTFTMPANAVTVTAVFEAATVTPTTYTVTISSAGTGATGGGNYAADATVTISAGTALAGQRFKNWTTTSSGVTFANANSATTTFTMPANAVTLKAVFVEVFSVTVLSAGIGATSSDDYAVGATVSISAGTAPVGQHFKNWATASRGVTLADANSATTTFTMPENAVTVRAAFGGTLTDSRDGQTYNTVKIGSQTWMAENLNIETADSWCYNNSVDSCAKYGRLYTWETATKFCPSGWHLPTSQEWEDLVTTAGGSSVAGKKLKSTSGWWYPVATDDFGFSALPGGKYGTYKSSFNGAGEYGDWWTATNFDLENYYGNYCGDFASMRYNSENVEIGCVNEYGEWKSVRCVQGSPTTNTVIVSNAGTGATGNGSYAAGVTVTISAGTAPSGQQFKNWTTTSRGVTLANANSATTTFTMPLNAVTVWAVFKGTFTDSRNGQTYEMVKIGSQTWMAENLNYATTSGSWCYENSPDSCAKYGRLYDWATAMAISTSYSSIKWGGSDVKHRGVCPLGWHLPSRDEWLDLAITAGESNLSNVSAGYLKSTSGWGDNNNGTDTYGFSALPGGQHRYDFYHAGRSGYWWTATEGRSDLAYYRFMEDNNNGTAVGDKQLFGFSMRCIQD